MVFVLFPLLLGAMLQSPTGAQIHVDYQLTKIDQQRTRVTPYFGFQAPKIVFDGDAYYSIGHWGDRPYPEPASGCIYRSEGGRWVKGYEWDDMDYQTGFLLLDREARLIVVSPKYNAPPVILRARAKGDIENFDPLPACPGIVRAGYVGGGIRDDKFVFGFIGGDKIYSFYLAILDLSSMKWSGPVLLAEAQREVEPWTTWLYPVIQPDADGVYLLVSNNPDKWARYDRVLYMKVPWEAFHQGQYDAQPEIVAPADRDRSWVVWGEAMHRAKDGSVYAAVRYQPTRSSRDRRYLDVYRRDPKSGRWARRSISERAIELKQLEAAAFYQRPCDGDRIWLTTAYDNRLRLYYSDDKFETWTEATLPSFASLGLKDASWLGGLDTFSGSVLADKPTAVFSTGGSERIMEYGIWFIQFDAPAPQGGEAATKDNGNYGAEQL